jgi:hypothetical protein
VRTSICRTRDVARVVDRADGDRLVFVVDPQYGQMPRASFHDDARVARLQNDIMPLALTLRRRPLHEGALHSGRGFPELL